MTMGFLKKKFGDPADEKARSSLFGSRKKSPLPAAAANNPYAAPVPGSAKDPYAQPPPYSVGADASQDYRREKTPAVTGQAYGGYGGGGNPGRDAPTRDIPSPGAPPPAAGGYSAQSGGYGANSGYGQDRFGSGQEQAPRRPGGYGGLGRSTSGETTNTDAGRQQLFGDAPKRVERQQPGVGGQPGMGGQPGIPAGQQGGSGRPGNFGGQSEQSGYGAYGDRELTAEEQEEEDITGTKSEIKFIKQQDVSSTRNALRLAQQAEETGRDTLQRLNAQGERIHNTEKNLDLASSQNRIAEEKARELKTLNKSMFAVHVANPFTTGARREERDRKIMELHQSDRAARDSTRQAAWDSTARSQSTQQKLAATGSGASKATLADRAKYQFEADSEDDEIENEIDSNLDALHGAAKRLNFIGREMGKEVDTQNGHIERIIGKTDKVDDQIAMNRARLDRIK